MFQCAVEYIVFVADGFGGCDLELVPFVEVGGLGSGQGDSAAEADIHLVELFVAGLFGAMRFFAVDNEAFDRADVVVSGEGFFGDIG